MIRLITGTPGAGKTLFTVTKLIKEINDNPERPIYSDIKGLKIEGVLPAPDDWRDAPEGSLLIYDECQYKPMFQKDRGRTKYAAVKDLTTHRHTGKDIWLITQSPNFLHADLLALVGEHIHLDRPMGAKLANVYKWRTAQDKPNGTTVKKRAEDTWLFKYDKNIFKYYQSVDVEEDKANHKGFKLPTWRVLPILAGIIGLAYSAWSIVFDGGIAPPSAQTTAQAAEEQATDTPPQTDSNLIKDAQSELTANISNDISPSLTQNSGQSIEQVNEVERRRLYLYSQNLPPDYQIRRHDPALQVRAVISKGNKCLAYNAYGDTMTLTQDECRDYVGTGRVYKSTAAVSDDTNFQAQAETPPTTLQAPTVLETSGEQKMAVLQ